MGFVAAWLIQHFRLNNRGAASPEELEELNRKRSEDLDGLARLDERARGLEETLAQSRSALEVLRDENTDLHSKLAAAGERSDGQEKRLVEQKQELVGIQKKLTLEFENLANRIMDEKSKRFVVQNKESLDKLLAPLNERIKDFRERVDKTHEEGLKDRAALNEQLKNLNSLNRQITEEARNLTFALKGQSKAQGNWGEMILERVLEKSGLVSGQEYETQASLSNEDGRCFQPDVLIKLPEDKHLVVDSKVSLIAYERCVNEDADALREKHLKEHVASLKSHVSDLSKKRYESLYGINSPDFVLMFIPIEPAFTLAMQSDDGLFDHAFRQNVVMVTPSTLLATLRTVANIWRQEKQTKNVLEIARRSGALYDKFVGFYADMEELGKRIGKSQETYEAAVNKLKSGKGNLVRSVEEIKTLGAKSKKSLPQEALEDAASS